MVLSRAAWQAELVELVRRHYPEVSADVVRRIALLASEGGLLSPEQPPLPPTVRVEATYPASDGSQPESVVVSWETGPPPADVVVAVIGALARVPGARDGGPHLVGASSEPDWTYPTALELLDGPLATERPR